MEDQKEQIGWQALELYGNWLDNMAAHTSEDWEYAMNLDAQSKELMIQEVYKVIGDNYEGLAEEIEKTANAIFDKVYFGEEEQ